MQLWLQLIFVNVLLSRLIERRKWRILTVVHAVCFTVIFLLMIVLSQNPLLIRAMDTALGYETAAAVRSSIDYAGATMSVTAMLSIAVQVLTLILILLGLPGLSRQIKKMLEYKWHATRPLYNITMPAYCITLPGREVLKRHCRCNS